MSTSTVLQIIFKKRRKKKKIHQYICIFFSKLIYFTLIKMCQFSSCFLRKRDIRKLYKELCIIASYNLQRIKQIYTYIYIPISLFQFEYCYSIISMYANHHRAVKHFSVSHEINVPIWCFS